MSKHYDYLIVGCGLTGSVIARGLTENLNKNVLIIDRRKHIGGNVYTRNVSGIQVHEYGAHIFHTSNKRIWDYVNQYADFNSYVNSPIARYGDEVYNLPFNMNTFHELWNDVVTPSDARKKIREQTAEYSGTEPENLEQQVLSIAGRDIYEKLVKGYTEKQWGRPCRDLPASIIKRLPFRFIYDNNYFDDRYQGIPIGGYTKMIEKILGHPNIEIMLETDYSDIRDNIARDVINDGGKIIWTGAIDEFFDYSLGKLQYRSLRFETDELDGVNDYQGNAVVNYTGIEVPWTRIIEHKHFDDSGVPDDMTVITREYPDEWTDGKERYYPVNDERNNALYEDYLFMSRNIGYFEDKGLGSPDNVIFAGRLGKYAYMDMDDSIEAALEVLQTEMIHN